MSVLFKHLFLLWATVSFAHSQAVAPITLRGSAAYDDGRPLKNVNISTTRGGISAITSGTFRLDLPSDVRPGQPITLIIDLPGYRIVEPEGGRINVPEGPNNPITVVVGPIRSANGIASEAKSNIFINKIINPPGRESGPVLSTVYLGCTGPNQFYIDSITITHVAGPLTSFGSGAQKPDAEYSFTFQYGSSETHTLNPALRLDPKDREVSFTLGLAPTGFFPSTGGYVFAHLHYHRNDGREGTLLLREADVDAKRLSALLSHDIQIRTILPSKDLRHRGDERDESGFLLVIAETVTPSGRQRGSDEQHDDAVPFIYLSKTPSTSELLQRRALNELILAKGQAPTIASWLQKADPLGYELCSALIIRECEEAIYKALPTEAAVKAISRYHYISPSDRLPRFVITHPSMKWGYQTRLIAESLSERRAGPWSRAVVILAREEPDALESVITHYHDLSDKEVQLIEGVCFDLLKQGSLYLRYPVVFLLSGDLALPQIETALLELPRNTTQANERATRRGWATELVGTAALSKVVGLPYKESFADPPKRFRPDEGILMLPTFDEIDGYNLLKRLPESPGELGQWAYPSQYLKDVADFIDSSGKQDSLMEMSKTLKFAADPAIYVMGYSASDRYDSLLVALLDDQTKRDWALEALSRRHLGGTSGILADALMHYSELTDQAASGNNDTSDRALAETGAIAALAARPRGNWESALLKELARHNSPEIAWQVAIMKYSEARPEVRSQWIDVAKRLLEAPTILPNLASAVLLAQLGGVPTSELRTAVLRFQKQDLRDDSLWREQNELFHAEEILEIKHKDH